MRKLFFIVLGLLFSAPFWGQEVVVFRDYRSLVVQSHRVQGDWTYLRVGGGELALLSQGILEIRQEAADSRAVTPSVPTGTAVGPVAPRSIAAQAPPPPMPFRAPQPAVANSLDPDDDDDEAPEADDEGDEEEPAKPVHPPAPIRPPPMSVGTVAKPGPLAPPQSIVQSK